ncbi:MAG: hypothetical protein HY717_06290 [Planctomycetes bacterium]|nr:hypothetical protein [Planctomycetota bacterium]
MEENVFHRPEVVRELKKYVEVRLHIDVEADWSRKLRDLKAERQQGNITLPAYEIVDPVTGKAVDAFFGADPDGTKFIEFLKRNAG